MEQKEKRGENELLFVVRHLVKQIENAETRQLTQKYALFYLTDSHPRRIN